MKHDDSRAGFSRYDRMRNAEGIDVPTFPVDPGPTHAVTEDSMYTDSDRRFGRATRRLDTVDGTDFDWEYTAECGRKVKVLLPGRFDSADQDSCSACVELMSAKDRSIIEYKQLRRDRRDRESQRVQKELKRRQAAEDERVRRMFESDEV